MAELIIKIETNKPTTRRILSSILAHIHGNIHDGLMNYDSKVFTNLGVRYGVNYKATITVDTEDENKELE